MTGDAGPGSLPGDAGPGHAGRDGVGADGAGAGGPGIDVERTVRIEASPATVFRYLSEPGLLEAWLGPAIGLDVRPGGELAIVVNPGTTARGRYQEVVADRRLVFTWGWDGNAVVPPGSTTVTVELEADGEATMVRLRHQGLDAPDDIARHRDGWQHYLERLSIAATGVSAGPDTWANGPPEPPVPSGLRSQSPSERSPSAPSARSEVGP